ncbi:MAG: type I DNA topoisomerase [Bacilli bacterium]|nr:type I DNA topoisomerase [Bacilli bacterium]
MSMKLVIVESPTKCTTIKRYLGEDYEVMASLGHIRDLATTGKGGLGVDVDNNFTPKYIISKDKQAIVKSLQDAKKRADEVILATDPDREGEAIAWHLAMVLNLDINKTKRLEFHEITRDSIGKAMQSPRTIDSNTVSSQETRRILDRIIGFKLSTLLNRKINSKSAGRVQSVALKLIYEHDKEIENFKSEEYWVINTLADLAGRELKLTFAGKNGKNITIKNKEEADAVLAGLGDDLVVTGVKKSFRSKESKEPFTTSTLQQEAFARLKFKTSKTQKVAQSLYEGIEVAGEHMGLITYMRTDSTRLSPTFIARATNYITETYGKEYLGHVKKGHVQELAQDAHEAIRPSSNHRTPESVKQYLTKDQYNLYKLIYNRALASLMAPKKEEVLSISLKSGDYDFKVEFAHTVFKGYEVILSDLEENEEYKGKFPEVNEGDTIKFINKEAEQKFTQPPAHYSEAKLVKLMEEVGIGRPSTYASTIDILQKRKYVEDNAGVLLVTDQGKKTVEFLEKYFKDIMNVQYTAQMEEKLDSIQSGEESRLSILNDFYNPFILQITTVKEIIKEEGKEATGEKCPKCGADLVYKDGKKGRFIGCSNFPKCKYVVKEPVELIYTGEMCPDCGGPLVERKDKRGKPFIACSNFPKCHYVKSKENPEVSNKICPKCGGKLLEKKGPYGRFLGCEHFPDCTYMEKIHKRKRK